MATYKIMVAFGVFSILTTLLVTGTASQMVEVDSSSMVLVEDAVAFPTVSGFKLDMDTFTWTAEEGTIVIGEMDMEMNTEVSMMYGNTGSYGSYGSSETGSYGNAKDVMEFVPYSVTLSTESAITVDGLASPLTASILSVSINDERCRSAAELRVNMDLILEIDSDCVLEWITRFEVGSSTREVMLQTINASLPGSVNLSQFVPENTAFFMGDTKSDGSSVNVFNEVVSISMEDLVSIAALLNAPVCAPTYSECNDALECCSDDDVCMDKNEFYSQCRPADQPFPQDMCMCPCDRPQRS